MPLHKPAPTYHELGLGKLDHAPADVHVALSDRLADACKRDAIALEKPWIDHNLILLDETAHAGDLGNTLGLCERIADVPIL